MNKQKSFTLIELLVVIVIIGILAGVIMISTSSSINKASIAKLKVFEESMTNDLAANMVSRWKLDEVNGTSTPDAWGNSDGTVSGALLQTTGCVSGNCLLFDGINDYVDCGNSDDLKMTNKLTISIWIKPITNVQANNPEILAKAGGASDYRIRMTNGGTVGSRYYGTTDTDTNTTSAMSITTFNFVVVSYDGSSNRVYKNGVLEANEPNSGDILETSNKFYLASNSGTSEFFNGLLDDVRIYKGALSSSQIKQNYIAGLDSLLSQGSILKEDYNQRISELAYEQ